MNPPLDQWLSSCARSPGTLGCGVQIPGRAGLSRSFDDGFPKTHLDETLRCFVEISPIFSGHGLFPRWFTWSFEQGQIRVAERPDGALLALVIRSNSPAADNMETLTGEFLALDLTDQT